MSGYATDLTVSQLFVSWCAFALRVGGLVVALSEEMYDEEGGRTKDERNH